MDGRYFDEWGLLVQYPDKDGGDSACEHCAYQLALGWLNKDDSLGRSLETLWNYTKSYLIKKDDPSKIRRHPDEEMWYRDWDRGTGDQWQNIIMLAGERRDYKVLRGFLLGFIARFFFCTNTFRRNYWHDKDEHILKSPSYKTWPEDLHYLDVIPDFRPFFIGIFIRTFRCWPLYPILFITDAFDLLAGAILSFFGGRKNRSGNDLNYIVKTEYARRNMPTPISLLAREIYQFRPIVHREQYVTYRLPNGPQTALDYQYKPPNPPMDELFKPIIAAWY